MGLMCLLVERLLQCRSSLCFHPVSGLLLSCLNTYRVRRAAIDRLSIIWKSDLTDKMKRSFFQAAVVSILLHGCTTWTLTKRLEKKLGGNYT